MPSFRSILSLILVAITTLLVSCGGPNANVPPPTYTPEKVAQIQVLLEPVAEGRERMSVLQGFIEDENWVDTQTYIHGPLGGIRRQMRYLSESLLDKDQKPAKQIAQKLFTDFERIDAAAKDRDYGRAVTQYRQALRDFDDYINLIPQA